MFSKREHNNQWHIGNKEYMIKTVMNAMHLVILGQMWDLISTNIGVQCPATTGATEVATGATFRELSRG